MIFLRRKIYSANFILSIVLKIINPILLELICLFQLIERKERNQDFGFVIWFFNFTFVGLLGEVPSRGEQG